MRPTVSHATVVLRVWEANGELTESEAVVGTLDELFTLCLRSGDPPLVDRIVLHGTDENGDARRLTLAFQSLTRLEE